MIKIYKPHAQNPEQRLGTMAASDAKQLLKTYTYYTEDPDSPTTRGYQRPPAENRFPQIAADIEKYGATNITISERGRWASLLGSGHSALEITVDRMVAELTAATSEEFFASIIDGQHRKGGADLLLSRGTDVEIPFLLYSNLTWAQEVERFNTINTTAKNLPRALVEVNRHAIFEPTGAPPREVQRQHVRDVVMALATDPASVWHEQVNMTGGRNTDRPVTFEGLRRSTEATFAGRLALLPLDKKIQFAQTYWQVVASTWPDAWNNVPVVGEWVNPESGDVEAKEEAVKYRIKDLAGVSGLAKIGNQVLLDAYNDETGQLNSGLIRSHLGRAKDVNWIKSPDNPDMNAQAGFSGLSDMYEMLLNRIYGSPRA